MKYETGAALWGGGDNPQAGMIPQPGGNRGECFFLKENICPIEENFFKNMWENVSPWNMTKKNYFL